MRDRRPELSGRASSEQCSRCARGLESAGVNAPTSTILGTLEERSARGIPALGDSRRSRRDGEQGQRETAPQRFASGERAPVEGDPVHRWPSPRPKTKAPNGSRATAPSASYSRSLHVRPDISLTRGELMDWRHIRHVPSKTTRGESSASSRRDLALLARRKVCDAAPLVVREIHEARRRSAPTRRRSTVASDASRRVSARLERRTLVGS